MKGEPTESARWYFGIGIALLLGTAYVAEEIVWIARRQGRPCASCGQKIRLKPFSLRINCPYCGKFVE